VVDVFSISASVSAYQMDASEIKNVLLVKFRENYVEKYNTVVCRRKLGEMEINALHKTLSSSLF